MIFLEAALISLSLSVYLLFQNSNIINFPLGILLLLFELFHVQRFSYSLD